MQQHHHHTKVNRVSHHAAINLRNISRGTVNDFDWLPEKHARNKKACMHVHAPQSLTKDGGAGIADSVFTQSQVLERCVVPAEMPMTSIMNEQERSITQQKRSHTKSVNATIVRDIIGLLEKQNSARNNQACVPVHAPQSLPEGGGTDITNLVLN